MYIQIHIGHILAHTHTNTDIVRENKIVLVSLFEGTMGGRRGKEDVRE
jgi:hypothetical protein